jgi:RimJ/RimL family protein N-acetyltransferase
MSGFASLMVKPKPKRRERAMTIGEAGDTMRAWPVDSSEAPAMFRSACGGLRNPALQFGPEWIVPRPRPGEAYYAAALSSTVVGLIWIQAPSRSTRTFGLGLWEQWRGRRLGPVIRDVALTLCFTDPDVWKVETEIYTSNDRSIRVLHQRFGRMTEEGIQRDTIQVDGVYWDRLLLGLTRSEWLYCAAQPKPREVG